MDPVSIYDETFCEKKFILNVWQGSEYASEVGCLRTWLMKKSSHLQVFYKIGALKNFANFTGICEIFKNTFFHRTPPVAAFVMKLCEQMRMEWKWSSPLVLFCQMFRGVKEGSKLTKKVNS